MKSKLERIEKLVEEIRDLQECIRENDENRRFLKNDNTDLLLQDLGDLENEHRDLMAELDANLSEDFDIDLSKFEVKYLTY